jgi:hypothetical protein
VIARLSVSGLSPKDAATAGSEVASTVESRFSMNKAQATISGIKVVRDTCASQREMRKRSQDLPEVPCCASSTRC